MGILGMVRDTRLVKLEKVFAFMCSTIYLPYRKFQCSEKLRRYLFGKTKTCDTVFTFSEVNRRGMKNKTHLLVLKKLKLCANTLLKEAPYQAVPNFYDIFINIIN